MIEAGRVPLEVSWKHRLSSEFDKDYMRALLAYLDTEIKTGKKIYPPATDLFHALDMTPFDNVKVVILGQDPYHGTGQAHGLCFSVQPGVRTPPSLVNIYKEMRTDLGIEPANHGCLEHWAKQGILLLNAVLSVEDGKAGAHAGKGWETFTDRIIHLLAEEKAGIAFVLWGAYAQKKGAFIDSQKHLVLKSAHPSPLSAHRGFFGSRPFSRINQYLESQGKSPISWQLP